VAGVFVLALGYPGPLVIIPTHEGNGIELSSLSANFGNPSWLPDGSGLLFDLRQDGGATRAAYGAFTASGPDLTDLTWLTDGYAETPVLASTAPPRPGMQRWGAPTTALRRKGTFGTTTRIAAPRW
jgi:hypothetical protein